MKNDDSLLEYILYQLASWGGVSSRRMFGGIGLYRDGKIFGVLFDGMAYLKVDATNIEDFKAEGSEPLKPYSDRPMTMSFYEIPPDVLEDNEALIAWAKQSLAIQKKKK